MRNDWYNANAISHDGTLAGLQQASAKVRTWLEQFGCKVVRERTVPMLYGDRPQWRVETPYGQRLLVPHQFGWHWVSI